MAKPYVVTREITIAATAARIHGLIVDLHQWREWSPWEGLDPDLKRTYSGPESGVGARYAWDGNKRAGKGTMEVTSSTPGEEVRIAVAFEKPFSARSTSTFRLVPNGEQTLVRWQLGGELNLLMQAFSLVKSMDSMMGPDLEKGLRQLKAAAEN